MRRSALLSLGCTLCWWSLALAAFRPVVEYKAYTDLTLANLIPQRTQLAPEDSNNETNNVTNRLSQQTAPEPVENVSVVTFPRNGWNVSRETEGTARGPVAVPRFATNSSEEDNSRITLESTTSAPMGTTEQNARQRMNASEVTAHNVPSVESDNNSSFPRLYGTSKAATSTTTSAPTRRYTTTAPVRSYITTTSAQRYTTATPVQTRVTSEPQFGHMNFVPLYSYNTYTTSAPLWTYDDPSYGHVDYLASRRTDAPYAGPSSQNIAEYTSSDRWAYSSKPVPPLNWASTYYGPPPSSPSFYQGPISTQQRTPIVDSQDYQQMEDRLSRRSDVVEAPPSLPSLLVRALRKAFDTMFEGLFNGEIVSLFSPACRISRAESPENEPLMALKNIFLKSPTEAALGAYTALIDAGYKLMKYFQPSFWVESTSTFMGLLKAMSIDLTGAENATFNTTESSLPPEMAMSLESGDIDSVRIARADEAVDPTAESGRLILQMAADAVQTWLWQSVTEEDVQAAANLMHDWLDDLRRAASAPLPQLKFLLDWLLPESPGTVVSRHSTPPQQPLRRRADVPRECRPPTAARSLRRIVQAKMLSVLFQFLMPVATDDTVPNLVGYERQRVDEHLCRIPILWTVTQTCGYASFFQASTAAENTEQSTSARARRSINYHRRFLKAAPPSRDPENDFHAFSELVKGWNNFETDNYELVDLGQKVWYPILKTLPLLLLVIGLKIVGLVLVSNILSPSVENFTPVDRIDSLTDQVLVAIEKGEQEEAAVIVEGDQSEAIIIQNTDTNGEKTEAIIVENENQAAIISGAENTVGQGEWTSSFEPDSSDGFIDSDTSSSEASTQEVSYIDTVQEETPAVVPAEIQHSADHGNPDENPTKAENTTFEKVPSLFNLLHLLSSSTSTNKVEEVKTEPTANDSTTQRTPTLVKVSESDESIGTDDKSEEQKQASVDEPDKSKNETTFEESYSYNLSPPISASATANDTEPADIANADDEEPTTSTMPETTEPGTSGYLEQEKQKEPETTEPVPKTEDKTHIGTSDISESNPDEAQASSQSETTELEDLTDARPSLFVSPTRPPSPLVEPANKTVDETHNGTSDINQYKPDEAQVSDLPETTKADELTDTQPSLLESPTRLPSLLAEPVNKTEDESQNGASDINKSNADEAQASDQPETTKAEELTDTQPSLLESPTRLPSPLVKPVNKTEDETQNGTSDINESNVDEEQAPDQPETTEAEELTDTQPSLLESPTRLPSLLAEPVNKTEDETQNGTSDINESNADETQASDQPETTEAEELTDTQQSLLESPIRLPSPPAEVEGSGLSPEEISAQETALVNKIKAAIGQALRARQESSDPQSFDLADLNSLVLDFRENELF